MPSRPNVSSSYIVKWPLNNIEFKMPNTPAEIISKLEDSFVKAQDAGELLFFPSTVHTHEEYGVEVRKFTIKSLIPGYVVMSHLLLVGNSPLPCTTEEAPFAYPAF